MATDLAAATGKRPVAGTWVIDSVHSVVSFTIEHFTIAVARGIAAGPTGSITIGDDLERSSVEASIDVGTITTANPVRDEKIRGPEVLDAAQYPTIDFRSSAVRLGETSSRVEGELTMHGTTRPVTLDVEVHGVVKDVWEKQRLGMTVSAEIKRSDFGAGDWGHVALAGGGFMVPDDVRVVMEIEATLDESGGASS